MSPAAISPAEIARVRSFNRLVTRQVGALNDRYLGHRPLGESRVLFEIGTAAATPRAAVVGIAMFGAYAIALAALEIAEAAPVAALRETSVVMATAAAALVARERVRPLRIAGAVIVVAGIAAIALA